MSSEIDHTTGEEGKDSTESDEAEWVKLDMKLLNWSYMDFSRTVKVDTSLYTIKEAIKNHHGGNIKSLTVCKDSYQETNELRGDQLTLKEYGIAGACNKKEAPVVVVYYDFKPDGCNNPDPVLMC